MSAVPEGNKLFPVFLKLENMNVLIVGAGNVALEKLRAILENSPGTTVTVAGARIKPELLSFAADFLNVKVIERKYDGSLLKSADIVIVAVNDIPLAEQIVTDAHTQGLLVNVADKPALCDFYLSSVMKKGDLKIAISTNGKSPTMAKRVKETLDEAFPDEMDEVLENLYKIRNDLNGDFREKVKKLNEITSTLAVNNELNAGTRSRIFFRRIRKAALYSLVVILLMIFGHVALTYIPTGGIVSGLKTAVGSDFLLYLAGGFVAQMIDGALGMAYGVSVTTFLLSLGVPAITPAVASASMHASEVFTTGTASLVYMRFRNINKKLFMKLLLPGVLGAIAGSALISFVSKDSFSFVRPIVSAYTFLLGASIILKAFNITFFKREKIKAIRPLAAVGGFLDTVGGGGWGPIVTTSLIAGGRNMRYAVGSSHLAKFFVALVSSITFFALIGMDHWKIISGLVVGGMIAAPISIYFSSKIPIKKGLVIVGILVMLISLKTLIQLVIE